MYLLTYIQSKLDFICLLDHTDVLPFPFNLETGKHNWAQTFCILMRNSEMFGKNNTFVLVTYFSFNILRDSIYMLLNHLHLDYFFLKKRFRSSICHPKALEVFLFSSSSLLKHTRRGNHDLPSINKHRHQMFRVDLET